MVKCKVHDEWFEAVDKCGYKYNLWMVKDDVSSVFCKICAKKISVYHNGFTAVHNHENTVTHKKQVALKLSDKQLKLVAVSGEVVAESLPKRSVTSTVQTFSIQDSVLKAEICWALKVISAGMSAKSSCDDIDNVFKHMFPCTISDKFSMGRTKFGYVLTEALGPHCRKELLDDINTSSYTIAYDETTNSQSHKELQVRIRYWSESQMAVTSCHLESFFIGTATAAVLAKHINEAINGAGLSKKNLLMLASDGPNVNKAVFKIINEEVKILRKKPLLDLGSCDLHIVNNAFHKGIETFGGEISELVIDVYYFFKGWPQRGEDFGEIQKKLDIVGHKFIKHVSTRWLTLRDASVRILEQIEALKDYLLKFIPKDRPSLMATSKYKAITAQLKDKFFLPKLHFIIKISSLMNGFINFFQTKEPLIHVLFEYLRDLLVQLMSLVCKTDTVVNLKTFSADDLFKKENLLPVLEIDIGTDTNSHMAATGFNDKDRLVFRKTCQQHIIAICKHIIQKSSLAMGTFLRYCTELSPRNILNSKVNHIQYIMEKLSVTCNKDDLTNEWNLLIVNEKEYIERNQTLKVVPFWAPIFERKYENNISKYPNIAKVIKACLSLSHGSADVERGFSESGQIITQEKTAMKLKTLNAKLNVRSVLRKYNNKPYLFPITNDLLKRVKSAHKSYEMYLATERAKDEDRRKQTEKQLQEAAENENKRNSLLHKKEMIASLEAELKIADKASSSSAKAADILLREANERLTEALSKNDLEGARVAQQLLTSYKRLKHDEEEKVKEKERLHKTISKRQNSLLTDALRRDDKKKQRTIT